MKKKIWDLYAPLYEKAMRENIKICRFMYDSYDSIPQAIRDRAALIRGGLDGAVRLGPADGRQARRKQ